MSRIQVVTLPQIGEISVVCKSKRDIAGETPLDKRDDESLGWGYWDRIWPSAMALSEFLIHQYFPTKLAGAKVIEIGCGTGLVGVVAARLGALTTFSDMVSIALEGIKESCRLNHISNFTTCTLDWSEKTETTKQYDLVLGSELFYEEEFVSDISYLLDQILASDGKEIFCDPNRLGLDTLELAFQGKFTLSVKPISLNWPPQKGSGTGKHVYLYELTRKGSAASY